MKKEKDFTFTYNCEGCCSCISGVKQKTIKAYNKNEAEIKIREFLEKIKGVLCMKFF